MVTKEFEGTKAEVEEKVASYMREYSPCAYDTRVARKVEKPDGTVSVTVTRYDNSD